MQPDNNFINEKLWVKGLLDSDEASFRAVYDAYQRPVYSFAFYLTKSKDVAEEVVQEVFIRLWEKRSLLSAETYLLAYIKKMTQNLVLDIFRKAGRDRELQQKMYQWMLELENQRADQLVEKELTRAYQEAIENLPPQQRAVFQLSRDGELTYQEIADMLGLSRNTVRNHMADAIKSVRRYVEHHSGLTSLIMAILMRENMK